MEGSSKWTNQSLNDHVGRMPRAGWVFGIIERGQTGLNVGKPEGSL